MTLREVVERLSILVEDGMGEELVYIFDAGEPTTQVLDVITTRFTRDGTLEIAATLIIGSPP